MLPLPPHFHPDINLSTTERWSSDLCPNAAKTIHITSLSSILIVSEAQEQRSFPWVEIISVDIFHSSFLLSISIVYQYKRNPFLQDTTLGFGKQIRVILALLSQFAHSHIFLFIT